MRVERIHRLEALAPYIPAWNRLAGGIPFRRFEWLGTWWTHYEPVMKRMGRDVELFVLGVFEESELIGVAPCYIDRSLASGRLVRLLGTGEVCSDYLSILCDANRQAEVTEAIAEWLMPSGEALRTSADEWDFLELNGVDASDAMLERVCDRLQYRGAEVHRRAVERTWRIELPRTMEEFVDRLSKSHRKQLRQFQRRQFALGRAVLKTVEHKDQIETGWQILVDLHRRRLESLGKPDIFQSTTFTEFLRNATVAMFHAGRLRLHWLELDGRAIAAEYHLAGDDVVFAYQGGIEPESLHEEPGRLITLATLQRVIHDGYQAFDFCRGDEPYKAHWRAEPRDSVNCRIVNDRSSARIRNSLWIAGQGARSLVKNGLVAAGLKH